MQRLLVAWLALVLTVATSSGCSAQAMKADDVDIKTLLDDPASRHGDFLFVREGYLHRFAVQPDSCELLGLFEEDPTVLVPSGSSCVDPSQFEREVRFIWLLFGADDDCAPEPVFDSIPTDPVTVEGYFKETTDPAAVTPWRGVICVAVIQ